MPTIVISGQIIEFPDSAQSPNWAPPVIEFAQAVEGVLEAVAGPFDVPPNTLVIDSYNPGTNIDLPALVFPATDVRSAFIRYAVFRTTSSTTVYETGNIIVVYNPAGSIGQKWEISRDAVGDGQITFNITDTGQVQFTTATLGGINHTGLITYTAQALLNS